MKKQPIADDKKSPDRVCRGGSWGSSAGGARVSFRCWNYASSRSNRQGFRIVRNKDTKK